MKKFLALVMALVMTMSLVTISAGADFTDDTSITYEEAVDVMTAIGVVGGYADGSFNPTGTLTRGAAAKIICNMILGPTEAGALATVEAPFSDVPADHVFAGYIAYCVSEGIVSGYTDGTFKPAGTLTGYAFMKMLLGALGYDAIAEGYTGSNFSINVAKRALNIGLDDGLEGAFVGSKALTREEACLYAFNALNAQMVEYDNNSTITIGDVVISNNSKAEGKTTGSPAVPVLFRDEYFKDLAKEEGSANGVDTFGRPAHTWYTSQTKQNKDTKIGTYGDTADAVLVLKDVLNIDEMLKDEDYFDYEAADVAVTKAYLNGVEKIEGDADFTTTVDLAKGDIVEVYNNDAGQAKTVVVLRYSIGQITDVSTKLTKAQKEDGATCKIQIAGGSYYFDNDITGFDAETYVEDAYILYIAKSTDLIASEIPESVEGTITAVKGSKVAVDGVYYEDTTSAGYGDEGIYYLDKAERIVASESTAAKSDNYAYIYNVTVKEAADADGVDKETVTVYYVTADGTKGSAPAKFEKETIGDPATSYKYYLDDGVAGFGGTLLATYTVSSSTLTAAKDVVAFSVNSDGKFVEETAQDSIAASGASATVNKTAPMVDNSKVATDDTTFVFVYVDDGAYVTKVVTGYKNVTATATMQTVYNEDNEAIFTFVAGSNGQVTSDAKLAVLLDTAYVVTEDADDNVIYTYDVAIDGEETTLSFKSGDAIGSAYAGMVFAYKFVGDYAQIDTSVTATGNFTSGVASQSAVVGKGAGYFTVGSPAVYYSTVDAEVYTITIEFEDTTSKDAYVADVTGSYTIDDITVSEGATFDAGDWVYYTVADTNEAEVVFVVEFVD